MNRFLLIVFVSIRFVAYSQEESKDYSRFKEDIRFSIGSITDLKGNKVEGLIEKLQFDLPYNKVVFVSREGGKQVFRPYELKGYDMLYVKFVSDGWSFLELIREEERIELFKKITIHYNNPPMANGQPGIMMLRKKDEDMERTHFYVKKKGTDKFAKLPNGNFRGKAYKMISDCQELVEDINNGVVKRSSTDEIVYRYNKTCK